MSWCYAVTCSEQMPLMQVRLHLHVILATIESVLVWQLSAVLRTNQAYWCKRDFLDHYNLDIFKADDVSEHANDRKHWMQFMEDLTKLISLSKVNKPLK